jgi:hypothetical protein
MMRIIIKNTTFSYYQRFDSDATSIIANARAQRLGPGLIWPARRARCLFFVFHFSFFTLSRLPGRAI